MQEDWRKSLDSRLSLTQSDSRRRRMTRELIRKSFMDGNELLAQEADIEPMKIFLPIWAANTMARMMEAKAKRKGEKPLMTTFSIYNLARNNDFDSSKAMRELGYRTRTYRETMRDEIAWLKSMGIIDISGAKATKDRKKISAAA